MPSGSADDDGSDESDESEVTEADAVDGDANGENRPKDPVLFLFHGVKRVLHWIDGLYDKYEPLPGRIKFGLGAVSFLSSAYFGTTIKSILDVVVIARFVSALEVFVGFALGMQTTLLFLTFLLLQSSIANHRLKSIGDIVETEEMDSDEVRSDGGVQVKRVETSEAGAVGGAGFGAVFGAMFGYSTIFGGMIFGAIVGNLIEERSVRKQKQRRLRGRIVSYLLRERVFEPESVTAETVRSWFPADDAAFVTEAVEDLLADEDSPVVRVRNEEIQLTTPSEAVTYLDRNGGRVPAEFEGPNRPR